MGSGVWFRNIISKKKGKKTVTVVRPQKPVEKPAEPESVDVCETEISLEKVCPVIATTGSAAQPSSRVVVSAEDAAATKIQAAYRAFLARKSFHRMRRMSRLQNMLQRDSVKKQASTTLSHLHSWSRIQAKIKSRRVDMVAEGRLKQKKMENQLKLEAKLHDHEVEWSAGTETADEALARIHQREEAAVRRERAMAYAFSHQWRANSSPAFGSGNQELSKANWGWSWMDRWIAARPWESRVEAQESPKKPPRRLPNKIGNGKPRISPTPDKVKAPSPNGKFAKKPRKLSFEGAAKIGTKRVSPNGDEKKP